MAWGRPQQSPSGCSVFRSGHRPHLRDAGHLPKGFFCLFFALKTKTTKISLYKPFFTQNNHQKQNDPFPKSKQNNTVMFIFLKQAICAQPCDWEEGDLIYFWGPLEGPRGAWSEDHGARALLVRFQNELQEFCNFKPRWSEPPQPSLIDFPRGVRFLSKELCKSKPPG